MFRIGSSCTPEKSDNPTKTEPKQDSDSYCLRVISTPLHTHSSKTKSSPQKRKMITKSVKRKRAPSHKKISKSSKSTKSKKALMLKCGKRTTVKSSKFKKTKLRLKASSIKPRGLGRNKAQLTTKKLEMKKMKSDTPRSQKKVKSPKSQVLKRKRSTPSTERLPAKKPKLDMKKRGTLLQCKKTPSIANKPVRLLIKKLKAKPSQHKKKAVRKMVQKVKRKISKSRPKLVASRHKTKRASDPHGTVCKGKSATVNVAWKQRLRPRPLKTARFKCYKPDCIARYYEEAQKKQMAVDAAQKSKQKKADIPAKRGSCNSNLCSWPENKEEEVWYDCGEQVDSESDSLAQDPEVLDTSNFVNIDLPGNEEMRNA